MNRRHTIALALAVLALAASASSALVHQNPQRTNAFIILFPLELLALPIAGILAARWLGVHPERAIGMLAVGLYQLAVAAALSTVYPLWLPSDNTVLGSALLAGVWAGIGTLVAFASAAVLANSSSRTTFVVAGIVAAIVFVVVTAGGMVSPLFRLQTPVLTPAVLAVAALLVARQQPTGLVQPVLLAAACAAATVAVLLLRGPGDWASASTSVKLYSFPILLMAVGLSLMLIDLTSTSKPHV